MGQGLDSQHQLLQHYRSRVKCHCGQGDKARVLPCGHASCIKVPPLPPPPLLRCPLLLSPLPPPRWLSMADAAASHEWFGLARTKVLSVWGSAGVLTGAGWASARNL